MRNNLSTRDVGDRLLAAISLRVEMEALRNPHSTPS